MVDHIADAQFEYNESQDYIDISSMIGSSHQQEKNKPKSTANVNGGGKKMKKIVVEKTPNPEVEEEKEFPQLTQQRPQTSHNQDSAWKHITQERIQKGEERKHEKAEKVTPYIDKQ